MSGIDVDDDPVDSDADEATKIVQEKRNSGSNGRGVVKGAQS